MIKRLVASTAAALLLTGVLTTLSSSPASAHPGVCVGQGQAGTGSPLFFPLFGPPKNTTFSFSLSVGVCSFGGSLTGTGAISGLLGGASCGQSTGSGSAAGHSYTFISVGTLFLFTGGVVGVANVVPDGTFGDSCTTGADRFHMTGGFVFPA